jgi:hypothetical protein
MSGNSMPRLCRDYPVDSRDCSSTPAAANNPRLGKQDVQIASFPQPETGINYPGGGMEISLPSKRATVTRQPLTFIDEFQRRNSRQLRKEVRVRARKEGHLARQKRNAASKPQSRPAGARSLLQKSDSGDGNISSAATTSTDQSLTSELESEINRQIVS